MANTTKSIFAGWSQPGRGRSRSIRRSSGQGGHRLFSTSLTQLGLGLLCLSVGLCAGGQTLYPIRDANTSAPPTAPAQAAPSPTNGVAPKSEINVLLKPTAIGPTGSSGLVQFKGETALLHVSRLSPGRYELQADRHHNGLPVSLGVLTVIDPTLAPSRQATDNKKEASAHPDSVAIETDVQMKLPPTLDPRDISRVQLFGPGGNAVLSGEPGGKSTANP